MSQSIYRTDKNVKLFVTRLEELEWGFISCVFHTKLLVTTFVVVVVF